MGDQEVGAFEHGSLGHELSDDDVRREWPQCVELSATPGGGHDGAVVVRKRSQSGGEVGGIGVLDGAEGEVGDGAVGREDVSDVRCQPAALAGVGPAAKGRARVAVRRAAATAGRGPAPAPLRAAPRARARRWRSLRRR